ncbi:MAG: hypothetical protein HY235_07810 [Acidobacteria bacterium]|nr:hypothetical protein [Acidobacteriota bacterium]
MHRLICPMLLLLAACSRPDPASEQARLEREFEQTMTGATLAGKFSLGSRVAEDRYTISKASKLRGDLWIIQTRIQYGKRDVTVPVPVAVKWAGDTPVIMLTDAGIPGLGTYTARVVIYRGQYAGTWSAKDHGGQMWGTVTRASGGRQQSTSARFLAVVEKIAGKVGFYDASGVRVAEAKVGTHPHEIVLSPDRRYAYVSDNGILWMTEPGEGGNTISILDLETRQKAGVISLGNYRRPHGMDVDPGTGRIVSTIENPDGLLLIDPAQRKVIRKYDVQGEDPHMVLLDAKAEYAYVSNTATHTLAAVHLESGKVKLIPVDKRPQGATLSTDGRLLYLTCSDGNSIVIIDTEKKERIGSIATGKGPGRVVLAPDGKTLVYNLQPGEAAGFADIASRKETSTIPLGGRPLSLTMSPDGQYAYAGIQDQDKVIVISVAERKIVQTIATPPKSGPDPALPLP